VSISTINCITIYCFRVHFSDHCIYVFFICTDYVGEWPSNKASCLDYYRKCANIISYSQPVTTNDQGNDDASNLAGNADTTEISDLDINDTNEGMSNKEEYGKNSPTFLQFNLIEKLCKK
jgi:hypothetical protein